MRTLAALAVAAMIAAGCSSSDDTPAATPKATTTTTAAPAVAWPVPDWETVAPASAKLDSAVLDAMATKAEGGGSSCLVVTRDGQLVDEHYWQDSNPATEHEAFSVTKSITSTLVGIAADQGKLDIDEPASNFITEWKGTPSEGVAIRDLLSMDSGRRQDFQTDYVDMASRAEDKTAFSIGLDQEHDPGTFWAYNNAGVQDLERVLEQATGQETADFARQYLFGPIGSASHIRTDAAGNTLTFMGAQSSCRDLARVGLLYLRKGEWDGTQVISSDYVAEATRPSQELNPGYGFLWWLGSGGGGGNTVSSQPASGGPVDDVYAAIGLFNQLIVVFPSAGVVVTRMGAEKGPDGSGFSLGDVADGITHALGDG